MNTRERELLPCPFCGSTNVNAAVGATGDGKPYHYIECADCEATAEPDCWNNRAIIAADRAQRQGDAQQAAVGFDEWAAKQGFTPEELNGPLHELSTCWQAALASQAVEIAALKSTIEAERDLNGRLLADAGRMEFLESSSIGVIRLDPKTWESDPMRVFLPIYINWMNELGSKWPEASYPLHRKTAREAIDAARAAIAKEGAQ